MLAVRVMLRITLTKTGEAPRSATFDKREITVGRTPSNDLVIPEPGVSSSHARILFTGHEITLIDLESTNGTFVNGNRIQGPCIVSTRDEVFICAHRLDFQLEGANAQAQGGSPDLAGADARGGPPRSTGRYGVVGTDPRVTGPQPAVPASEPPSRAPAPAFDGSAPPPLLSATPDAAAPASEVSVLGEPPRLVVPSSMGAAGPPPRLRMPDEPPTMPPMLGGPPALDPAPAIAPPPADIAPVVDIAPPSPVRTGATVLPGLDAAASEPPSIPPPSIPPPVAESAAPPSFAPIAAPEPVGPPEPAIARAPSHPPLEPIDVPVEVPPPEALAAPSGEPAPMGRLGDPSPASVPPRATSRAPVQRSTVPPVVATGQTGWSPAPMAPARPPTLVPVDEQANPVFDDLAGLHEIDRGRAACARVFMAIFDALSHKSELPARDGDTRARARAEALRLLSIAAETLPGIEVRPWAERIASELCGLGALTARLAEPDVREIFVHGPERVVVRRGDAPPTEIDARFSCPQAIAVVVRRLTDLSFGADNPILDAHTLDGAAVYAVHETIAPGGPVVNIRLPSASEPRWTLELLLRSGAMSPQAANLLVTAVQGNLNVLVCAGPGASAFPLVAALCDAAPAGERQVLVRPSYEPGVLPAETIVLEGEGLVGTDGGTVMQALVRTGFGLLPDRLIVCDVGGPEASDVLSAVGRGLGGITVSTRAGSPEAAVHRLATLCALAGGSADQPTRAQWVAQSFELVACVARTAGGIVRIVELAEATTVGGHARTMPILVYDPTAQAWLYTGHVPGFFAELQRRGIAVDASMLA
jgi:pilus assembly protein CpaF